MSNNETQAEGTDGDGEDESSAEAETTDESAGDGEASDQAETSEEPDGDDDGETDGEGDADGGSAKGGAAGMSDDERLEALGDQIEKAKAQAEDAVGSEHEPLFAESGEQGEDDKSIAPPG